MDPKRQASEAIKDLMVSEKKSRLPLILTLLVIVALLGGGAYWYILPPNQRPSLEEITTRAMGLANSLLNKPIMNAPTPAPNAPSTTNKTATPSSSKDSSGLLSN